MCEKYCNCKYCACIEKVCPHFLNNTDCADYFVCMEIDTCDNVYCKRKMFPTNDDIVRYPIFLTETEIEKVRGLIQVVIEPLEKASKKLIIPKQKREAEQTLAEVKEILNKFKKEIGVVTND